MENSFNYAGKVTLKFYDKNNNLKNTYSTHNLGTPYFFWVLTDILNHGTHSTVDKRPGKIMLTDKNGVAEFRVPISKIHSYSIPDVMKDSVGDDITDSTPCIRYEFNISYYDLKNNDEINNLTGYRLWLLSYSENSFKNANPPIDDSDSDSDDSDGDIRIESFLNKITYSTIDVYGKICAEVQIAQGPEENVNYSLNQGEYITVLWDMYFKNTQL